MSAEGIVFPEPEARRLLRRALEEDLGEGGDITSKAVFPSGRAVVTELVAREPLRAAGLPCCALVFEELVAFEAGSVEVHLRVRDGADVSRGDTLARISGDARSIFAGERLMLNLVARLCGIATLTAAAVREIEGTSARVSDTRKTTPGLRALEKYAVAVGGGENHRPRLDSLILVKDNHKELAGGVEAAIKAVEAAGYDPAEIEVEVDTLEEFDIALATGAGWILLDNMTPELVRQASARAGGRCRLEVSGGLRPGILRAYAEAGVDRLSMGFLTHAARSMDIALDLARG